MNPRHLILLTPYRLPTETTLYLGDEEVSAFLGGWTALWHPAALAAAEGLPRIASPYDHERPAAGHVYAVPDHPPLMLADDWEESAAAAGAVVFKATASRERTLQNLRDALDKALPADDPGRPLLGLPGERLGAFFGLGLGALVLEALFEAMSHENVLAGPELAEDVRAAARALAADPDAALVHLRSAADRQLAAREVVYPATVHVVDFLLLEEGKHDLLGAGAGQPVNVIACAALLEKLHAGQPGWFARLREQVAADRVEVLGGPYLEREDPLLPLESQVWNLRRGQAVYQHLLGKEVAVFARKRFGFHPQLPLLLQSVGVGRALLTPFDESVVPTHRAPVVSWPSHDGKQVDAFTRVPQPADSPQTFFNLAHHLHETIMQDQSATLALLLRDKPPAPWYDDWLELGRLAPVLGRWTTLSGYFNEAQTGDYTSPASPDEFHGDYLVERTTKDPASGARPTDFPVSGFAAQLRGRRRLDAAWTYTAVLRALGGQAEAVAGEAFADHLAALEDRFEAGPPVAAEELTAAHDAAAGALAKRLVARGQPDNPGYLLLNPCGFTRRVALELPGVVPPAAGGHIKRSQVDGDLARLVVEVPALGFAWVPKVSPPQQAAPVRMKLADERCVRNEFFEAEIDEQTGGLRAVRDPRTRVSRLGGMLVYNPGSSMRATQITTTSTGPALGEVVSEGHLLGEQGEVLATFRQRFRAWLSRPLLEIHVELTPARPPEGYPWHAYYAARFAWREESAALLRGAFGQASLTSQTRPETPEFLEVRAGRHNTVVFPGGLPFHQRNGGRMLDVVLVCEGETQTHFDLGVGLDRGQPAQTALGIASPLGVVACTQGPPHVGETGWLFHLDAPNVLLSSLRPADGSPDGVVASLLEVAGQGVQAGFRCVRNPARAVVQDLRGHVTQDAITEGDQVQVEVGPYDLLRLRVEFS
jgi:alpha-mannosidase